MGKALDEEALDLVVELLQRVGGALAAARNGLRRQQRAVLEAFGGGYLPCSQRATTAAVQQLACFCAAPKHVNKTVVSDTHSSNNTTTT